MFFNVKDTSICEGHAMSGQDTHDLHGRPINIGDGSLPFSGFKRGGSEATRFYGCDSMSRLSRRYRWSDEDTIFKTGIEVVPRRRCVQNPEPFTSGRTALKFRTLTNGKFSFDQTVNLIQQVWDTSHTHEVIVRPYKYSRSLEQNNMFHGLCREIASETGNTVAEIKDYCKENFLGVSSYEFNGEVKHRLLSTNELTTDQMSDLIARTEGLAAELGIKNATN